MEQIRTDHLVPVFSLNDCKIVWIVNYNPYMSDCEWHTFAWLCAARLVLCATVLQRPDTIGVN